jgi:UDP-N-acetylmuramate dehydrogenase
VKIEKNKSLKSLNQYGVDVRANTFVELKSVEEVLELINVHELNQKIQILGDGNNILFTKDFDGLIIKPNIKGKEVIKEDEENVWIKVYCGEDWDTFVRWAVENNYQGIENLVMIPSSIGGAVTQNIAAYGQNIMDVIEEVETVSLETGDKKIFSNEECGYKYRDSFFKGKYKNKYILISATFRLNKVTNELETNYHERESRYGSLIGELQSIAKEPYTIQDVMNAVIIQRTKRLPSINEYGTCGSVFANPVVSNKEFKRLSEIIPELQSYPVDKLQYTIKEWNKIKDEYVKIPAGRIIDQLGWIGKWSGNVGVSEKHALCVITNREATGKEVFTFLEDIKQDVKDTYGIDLTYEINII